MKSLLMEILIATLLAIYVTAMVFRARKPKVQFANIGEGTRESGRDSLLWDHANATTNAASLVANAVSSGRFLLVKKTTDADHITTCGAGDVSIGVCQDAYDANNEDVPVNVALHGAVPGIQRVVTDGTITDGVPIKAGANGQATAATTGDAGIFGRAYLRTDMTSAANDVINYIPDVPFKASF